MNGIKLRKRFFSNSEVLTSLNELSGFRVIARFSKSLSMAILLVVGLGLSEVTAQDRTEIRGTVTDASDGDPLPGASIIVQGSQEATGSTIGTTTGMDGSFTVRVPQNLNVLVVSFIGYISQTIEIDGRTEINIALQPDIRQLADVVVVGYGVQDRREITSAVASVSADDFVRGNINDAQELIQGKVAGLQITRPGGDPNADFTIRLRGLSTIGANTEPLIVVDGLIGGSFQSVDPNDIQSIEVLKDASAAAIYGTRGSNGVILITTKSGRVTPDGGLSVNYNGSVSTSIVANRYETLNASEYRALGDQGLSILDLGASTDWWEEVTQDAFTQSHSLAISGGNATTTYRVSGSFRDVQGIQKGSGNQRLNARLNINHVALDNRLTLTGNLSVNNTTQAIGLGEVFRYATTFNPTAPLDAPGSGFDNFNPLRINELSTWDQESNRYTFRANAQYDFSEFIDGLGGSVSYSRENEDFFRGEFYSRELRFRGAGRGGLALRETVNNNNELFETTATYRNTFDFVRIESVAGYSYQDFTSQGQFAEGGGFTNDNLLYNNLFFATDFDKGLGTVASFRAENKLIAFFGRANLTFDNTYFLSGTFRREGGTRFGDGNQWGNFFAVSGGAELTNIIDIPWASELKARVSYGETGTQPPFNGISQIRFGQGPSFLVDGEFVPSLAPVSNANPNLKWETKREVNAGIDFSFFNDRFFGSLDYYNSTTNDALFEITVPVPPNQFPQSWVNIGEISNEGFEASLGYNVIQTRDSRWTTSLTFATFSTTLDRLSNDEFTLGDLFIANVGAPGLNDFNMIRVKEGRSIGEIFGPKFVGFSQDGEWLFENVNGDIVRRDGDFDIDRDSQVIGNGLPDFTLGWDNTVQYKNWDFNMFWRGAFGHDLVNTFDIFFNNPTVAAAFNVSRDAPDLPLRESPFFSSFQVESADFFRLESLSIGYTFDLGALSGVRDLRLYASGNNLWTITNYSGVDPEVRFADVGPTDNAGRSGGGNPLAPGIERRNQWFTQTSFTLGASISF